MHFLRESTVQEYALQFWHRERGKFDPKNEKWFAQLDAGHDPVVVMKHAHDYKLPRPDNNYVSVRLVTKPDEVQGLIVHEYMPADQWMTERGLVPQPLTRRLGDLAALCLERGYFTSSRKDRQIHNFANWKRAGSLVSAISTEERPLIEVAGPDEYEIVDGWGRLLPVAALLTLGVPFEPFQVFFASPIPSNAWSLR